MVNTLNPWLRGLMRASKKQQSSITRAVIGLLAPAPKAPSKPGSRRGGVKKSRAVPPVHKAPHAAPAAKRTAAACAPPEHPHGAPMAPGKWLTSQYAGSGLLSMRRMHYWLYLPVRAPADPAAGMPLIIMLHGCDQSATSFAEGTRMNRVAEAEGYAVLYPQQSVSSHPNRCWKWYDRATQNGGGDVPLIVGMINKVAESYRIDRSRIYICGISAGAGMANIVALNHPELFAGIGLHSAPIFGAGHSTVGALAVMQRGADSRVHGAIAEVLLRQPDLASMPTILIQGEDDEVVRPINQSQLARQAMLVNDLPAECGDDVVLKVGNKNGHAYQLRDVYRGRKLMLRVATIAQLKHAWSGGDERLLYNSAGGPDASKMMVDFFSGHRRLDERRARRRIVRPAHA